MARASARGSPARNASRRSGFGAASIGRELRRLFLRDPFDDFGQLVDRVFEVVELRRDLALVDAPGERLGDALNERPALDPLAHIVEESFDASRFTVHRSPVVPSAASPPNG